MSILSGLVTAVCLLGAGCAPPASDTAAVRDSGPLLTMKTTGGFAPAAVPYRPPEFALYGDGRVIETPRAHPGEPRVARLTPAAVDRLAARARALGLEHGRHVRGDHQVPDGLTMTLTFAHAGGRSTTVVDPGAKGDLPAFGDQLALRDTPRGDLREQPRPYGTDRIAVLARTATGTTASRTRSWPLAAPEKVAALGAYRCRVYDGQDARHAATLLTNASTAWEAAGKPVLLTGYRLMPSERTCADLARRT